MQVKNVHAIDLDDLILIRSKSHKNDCESRPGGETMNENIQNTEVQEADKPLFLKSVVTPVDARVEMGLSKMCKNTFYGN